MHIQSSALHLPAPDEPAQALSRNLQAQISAEIDRHGPITFANYMELALYSPALGYYRNGAQKFGKDGDFITAPELSPLFSQCVARQCEEIIKNIPGADILEFGAGSGAMARVILQTLAASDALPRHYYILELSAELQQRQRLELQTHAPELLDRVSWLSCLPSKFNGVVLANEVLDAMPIHRFGYWQGLKEYYVTEKNGAFAWELGPLSSISLRQQLEALEIEFSEGYSSEINAVLPSWLSSLSERLESAVVLLTDYGLTRREYYHADRGCGTLICHYRHRAHVDPFWWPGLQDITAQVDFTAVAMAAVSADLDVYGYTTQAGFLLNCGITDFMEGVEELDLRSSLSRQIQKLMLPGDNMGEAFKAMALTKNYEGSLLGFTNMNQIERL